MTRAFASVFWLFAALALGLETVAEPCELAAELQITSDAAMSHDMPCHDEMPAQAPNQHEMPEHGAQTCCCAALLSNGVAATAPELSQPIPVLTNWAAPLPDSAQSIFLEFEPPPPRA